MQDVKVLIVTTSHDTMGDSGKKTGIWLEELAGPYYTYSDEGAHITLASPKGGAVPIDPMSEEKDALTEHTKRFKEDEKAMDMLHNSVQLSSLRPSDFEILFFPGGHGPMWDMPNNRVVAPFVNYFQQTDKPIGLVCHGVAALIGIYNDLSLPFVRNRKVTGFTNAEEKEVGLRDVVPFLLENKLRDEGANFKKGPNWKSFVVTDGNLVTGQNPASSVAAAKRTIALWRVSAPAEPSAE